MNYEIRHTGTVEIETDRLLLRAILLSDAQSLYELVSDEEVLKYLSGIPVYTGKEMAVDYIKNKLTKKYQNADFYDWAVVLKSENKMIGRISIYKQDDYRRMADLVWCLNPAYRDNGYISEGVKAVINHLFEIGFERIEAFADVENKASTKVMAKVGMQYEGTLRKYDCRRDDSLYDAEMWSIIKERKMEYKNKYKNIIEEKYNNYQEDERFNRKSQSFEYRTTMNYIQKYLKKGSKILEIGAGTGRYSIALAKMGYDVTAVELVESNLKVLRENSKGLDNLKSYQGDVLNLQFEDNSFDLVLCLGPMYHLFNKKDKDRAIAETIKVCKQKGICMFAYLTHSSIIWAYGVRKGNLKNLAYALNKDGSIKDVPEEIFSSYFVEDFAKQFEKTDTTFLKSVATDGLAPIMRDYIDDGMMDDEDIELLYNLHLATCERLDHQGYSSHMLYICKKN